MIQITELAYTGYPVTEIARARAFYEGALQLKPTSVFEHEGRHWIEYDVGPATLAISNVAPEWKPSADGPSVAFEVADFDGAVAALRGAGVKFVSELKDTPVCRLVVIADPDGNTLTIHQRKLPSQ